MSTAILLVHGMGTHKPGEFKASFRKAVEDATERFGQSKDDLFEGVVVEEFNYSDYFDAIRKQFAENAAARQQGFGFLSGSGFDDKLVQDDDSGVFVTIDLLKMVEDKKAQINRHTRNL